MRNDTSSLLYFPHRLSSNPFHLSVDVGGMGHRTSTVGAPDDSRSSNSNSNNINSNSINSNINSNVFGASASAFGFTNTTGSEPGRLVRSSSSSSSSSATAQDLADKVISALT